MARLQLGSFFILVGATALVAMATAHGQPDLLSILTREDGPVEWLTTLLLLALGIYSLSQSGLPFKLLGVLGVLGAGEEISWGQRVFGFETAPEILRTHNLQGESNLHNLLPSPTFNGIILITLLLLTVVFPAVAKDSPYAAGPELQGFFFAAVAINHYRIESPGEGLGSILVGLFFLIWLVRFRTRPAVLAMTVAILTMSAILFRCREVLTVHNHQYEIRELVLVVMIGLWCLDTKRKLMAADDVLEDT